MRLKEGRIAPLRKKNGKWRTACTSPINKSQSKLNDGDFSPTNSPINKGK